MVRHLSHLTLVALLVGGCAQPMSSNGRNNNGGRDGGTPDLSDPSEEETPDLKKAKDQGGTPSGDEDLAEPGPDTDAGSDADLAGGTVGGNPDLAGGGTTPSTVTGVLNINYMLADGTVDTKPVDLTDSFVTAYLPTSAGFDPIAIEGDVGADGTFSLADVPDGTFYLELLLGTQTPTYYVTDARSLDLSYTFAGRPDAPAAGDSTKLQLYFNFPTGQKWNTSSSNLQFYSGNAGAFAYTLDYNATSGAPANNATAIDGMLTPYTEAAIDAPWLVSTSAGDDAYFVLQQAATATGVSYLTPAAVANVSSLNLTTNTTNSVGTSGSKVAMTAVAASDNVNVSSWPRGTWDTLKTAVNASATARYQYLTVEAQPGGLGRGLIGPNPVVLDLFSTATTTVSPGTMSFGNPYPTGWELYGSASAVFQVSFTQGAGTAATYSPSIFMMKPKASFSGAVTPLVSPVRNAKIDGKALTSAQTGGDPDNTVISWEEPTTGPTHFYEVYLYSLKVASGATQITNEARIITTQTSVTIPPALLLTGSYFFTIRAFHSPGSDVKSKPEVRGSTFGWADFVSSKVTF